MTRNYTPGWRLERIFTRPYFFLAVAAVAALYIVKWLFNHEQLASPARPILAFMPALLAIFFVIALVRDIRRLDEMGRRIHLQAASVAFLLTAILAFLFLGLASAGIYHATVSELFDGAVFAWGIALIYFTGRQC